MRTLGDTEMKNIQIEKKSNRVGLIQLNAPGDSPNIVSREFLDELGQALKSVSEDPEIDAAVLVSLKDDHFIKGAHLGQLLDIQSEKEIESLYFSCQSLIKTIEG